MPDFEQQASDIVADLIHGLGTESKDRLRPLSGKVATALRQVHADAIESAAKVAEDHGCTDSTITNTAANTIGRAIRALAVKEAGGGA